MLITNSSYSSLGLFHRSKAAQQQVAMQAVNPELLKENVQDSYVANRIGETTEDPKGMMYTAALTVPTWFAIAKGMDVYANRSRGDFENTVHHKVGQFGDDVTNYVKNSSFGKSSFATSINNGFKSFKGFFKKNFVDRFKITRAFAYTPSKPELPMVIGRLMVWLVCSCLIIRNMVKNL